MAPNFKITIWLFAVYLLGFILLWQQSRHPQVKDVPVLFLSGIMVALVALFDVKNKTANKVLLVADIVLFLANVLNFWAAIRIIRGFMG